MRGIILVIALAIVPAGVFSTERFSSGAHNTTSTRELLLVAAGWDPAEASRAALAGSGADCGVDTVVVIATDSSPDLLSDVLDPLIHANLTHAANPDARGKGGAAGSDALVLVVGGGGEEALGAPQWRDLARRDSVP
jgi:hypothetical protein